VSGWQYSRDKSTPHGTVTLHSTLDETLAATEVKAYRVVIMARTWTDDVLPKLYGPEKIEDKITFPTNGTHLVVEMLVFIRGLASHR